MKFYFTFLILFWLFSCESKKGASKQMMTHPVIQENVAETISSKTENIKNDTFQKKVYVWIKEDSINFKKLEENYTLTVFNNSDKPITFGKEFQVESYSDNKWNVINSHIVFPEMAYGLQPGRRYDLTFSPKFDGGLNFPGNYRINKPFFIDNNDLNRGFATDNFKVYTPLIGGLEQKVFLEIPKTFKMSELKNKVFYKVINNTKNTILFGDRYELQKFNGKDWQKIKLSFFVQDIGYTLHPGTEGFQERFYFKFYPEQYQYKPGLYRILKNYYSKSGSGLSFRGIPYEKDPMLSEFRIIN